METKFKCDICGKVCKTKRNLELHMLTHKKETIPGPVEENNTSTSTNIIDESLIGKIELPTNEEIIEPGLDNELANSIEELKEEIFKELKPAIEKINDFVADKIGRNRWTTTEAETAFNLFKEKTGKNPGHIRCTQCIQHVWNTLLAIYNENKQK